MNSETVWFEQIYGALIPYIKSVVTHRNAEGTMQALEYVSVRKPEEDFKVEVYPSVTLYTLSYRHNAYRAPQYTAKYLEYDKSSGSYEAKLEDYAIPFDITIQIDFWSKFQSQMGDMTSSWLAKAYKQFNLSAKTVSDTPISVNCVRTGNVAIQDFVDGIERKFHQAMTYRIWAEIDERIQKDTQVVAKVESDVQVIPKIVIIK